MDASMDTESRKCPWTVHGRDTSWTKKILFPDKIDDRIRINKEFNDNSDEVYRVFVLFFTPTDLILKGGKIRRQLKFSKKN